MKHLPHVADPLKTRRRLLLAGIITVLIGVLGHFAFACSWPRYYRIAEVGALLSAPSYFCLGILEWLRYQRNWQVVAGVILSGLQLPLFA